MLEVMLFFKVAGFALKYIRRKIDFVVFGEYLGLLNKELDQKSCFCGICLISISFPACSKWQLHLLASFSIKKGHISSNNSITFIRMTCYSATRVENTRQSLITSLS